ncbi:MAG: hypothetical protein ACO4CW_12455 [Planctomycetota bacterium]|jgi:hypothetical protein
MEGENGILHQPDVEEALRRMERFEIYTDDPDEKHLAALQREITGYNANPTYIVLDSTSRLEVARIAYTNSKGEFLDFLERGLTDVPAFRSQVRFTGTTIIEGGEDVVVLVPEGTLQADAGADAVYQEQEIRVYDGRFSGSQTFRVGRDLEGEYPLNLHLVTGLYDGDERLRSLSVTAKVYIEVID